MIGADPRRFFRKIYCSSCGLEIRPDEPLIPYRYNDVYHDFPYACYPFDRPDPDSEDIS